ncbi:MAG: ion channel [Salibacteraceae bacterium]
MLEKLYQLRFEVFLTTQLLILFGSLLVTQEVHEEFLLPGLFLLNIAVGILILSKQKKLMWFSMLLFGTAVLIFGDSMISRRGEEGSLVRLAIYFLFYTVLTFNIIRQVWTSKTVTRKVILGLMSGYLALGFLGFFLFMSIELLHPTSFTGLLLEAGDFRLKMDGIMYYSFITLLTIGYGEIVPVTPVAQKAAILVGLAGQFYLVIITAVVVEKYIRHSVNR